MMKRFWIEGLLCTALLATGVVVFTTPSDAKPAYLTAEKAKEPGRQELYLLSCQRQRQGWSEPDRDLLWQG